MSAFGGRAALEPERDASDQVMGIQGCRQRWPVPGEVNVNSGFTWVKWYSTNNATLLVIR